MLGTTEIIGYRRKWGRAEFPRVTSRENQILRLVAEGKTNQEIAECLCISIATVKVHLANVYDKLGVNRRYEAVAILSAQASYPEAIAS